MSGGGFAHDIAGGDGTLIATSVHSPNFKLSPLTGWSIDKNGTAYFESVVIGGGVVRVTFAATAPSNPNTGDVWFDLSAGAQPNVWAGSSWTSYQWGTNSIADAAITGTLIAAATITASNIANATITSTQIASGTITGGNIASATIDGTNIAAATIDGTNIASGTITGSNIGSATIDGSNIASGTITASNIEDATITTAQISNSAGITGDQIAAGTITASNITDATITATQIAANAGIAGSQLSASAGITGSQITSGTITASNIESGTITASQIASGTITGSNIAGATITASNIEDATITDVQIASGSITGSNIGSGTITGANLADETVTSVQIANGTITTTQISGLAAITGSQLSSSAGITAGQVSFTASEIGGVQVTFSATAPASPDTGDLWYDTSSGNQLNEWDGSAWTAYQYGTSAIAAGAVTAAVIASGTITASQIASGTITGSNIAGTTITASNIASGTITATQIASGTITGSNIAASTIEGSNIDAATIEAANIASGTITATQIASGTITGSNIAGTTITASQIAAGAIGTTELAANAVTAAKIAANTITASQLAAGIVYAGIVDSTTVNAATFTGSVFDGTDFELNSLGAFWYSSTPTTGNLIASITSAAGSDDGHGNAYQAGVNIYGATNGLLGMEFFGGGNPAGIRMVPDNAPSSIFSDPGIASFSNNTGSAQYTGVALESGELASGSGVAEVVAYSGSTDGTTSIPHVSVYGGPSSGLLADFNENGLTLSTATQSWMAVGSQSDTSSITISNATSATDITAHYTTDSVLASGLVYDLVTEFNGTWGNQTFTFYANINGTRTALATIGATFGSSGVSYNGWVRMTVRMVSATGCRIHLKGAMVNSALNSGHLLESSTVAISSTMTTGISIAAGDYIAISGAWGASATQNLETLGSTFTRSGNP